MGFAMRLKILLYAVWYVSVIGNASGDDSRATRQLNLWLRRGEAQLWDAMRLTTFLLLDRVARFGVPPIACSLERV